MQIEGVAVGAILSDYQRIRVENVYVHSRVSSVYLSAILVNSAFVLQLLTTWTCIFGVFVAARSVGVITRDD